jgi:polyribonucleotide nucleotidyltransferase
LPGRFFYRQTQEFLSHLFSVTLFQTKRDVIIPHSNGFPRAWPDGSGQGGQAKGLQHMPQAAPAPHQVTVEVGGRTLTLETGKIAKQANGAVLARYGDTVVLVTACMDTKPNDRDFLPLTVDYREYTYSAGKIPGGFFKREGRPSEREILTSRMIDRPLRPLFPESWRNETQIVAMVLSADSENDPDMIGITGASAAAFISDLPYTEPVAAVRVGLIDGKFLANPTVAQQKTSLLNIIVVASEKAIVMIEAGAMEVSEDTVADALQFGHDQVKLIITAIQIGRAHV